MSSPRCDSEVPVVQSSLKECISRLGKRREDTSERPNRHIVRADAWQKVTLEEAFMLNSDIKMSSKETIALSERTGLTKHWITSWMQRRRMLARRDKKSAKKKEKGRTYIEESCPTLVKFEHQDDAIDLSRSVCPSASPSSAKYIAYIKTENRDGLSDLPLPSAGPVEQAKPTWNTPTSDPIRPPLHDKSFSSRFAALSSTKPHLSVSNTKRCSSPEIVASPSLPTNNSNSKSLETPSPLSPSLSLNSFLHNPVLIPSPFQTGQVFSASTEQAPPTEIPVSFSFSYKPNRCGLYLPRACDRSTFAANSSAYTHSTEPEFASNTAYDAGLSSSLRHRKNSTMDHARKYSVFSPYFTSLSVPQEQAVRRNSDYVASASPYPAVSESLPIISPNPVYPFQALPPDDVVMQPEHDAHTTLEQRSSPKMQVTPQTPPPPPLDSNYDSLGIRRPSATDIFASSPQITTEKALQMLDPALLERNPAEAMFYMMYLKRRGLNWEGSEHLYRLAIISPMSRAL